MYIDSICVSWLDIENRYLITILTYNEGLIKKYAKDIIEAISIIQKLEEKYGT